MKKIVVSALILFSLLCACKKNNDSYYIRCTINGVARTFNVNTYAHHETDPVSQRKGIGMGGHATSDLEGDWFGFWVDNIPSGNAIIAGTYTGTMTDFGLLGTFTDDAAGFDWYGGSSVEEDAVTYGVTISNHFTLTIQSIDGKAIRGTFSGDFYADGDVQNGAKKSITNGEFYLKFK
jgi:hypothetical protein